MIFFLVFLDEKIVYLKEKSDYQHDFVTEPDNCTGSKSFGVSTALFDIGLFQQKVVLGASDIVLFF